MKPPDLSSVNQDIEFPIKIPIQMHYMYKPVRHHIVHPINDYINFKTCLGNEILLYLEKPENLRDSEILAALIELSKRTPKAGNASVSSLLRYKKSIETNIRGFRKS